jgi:hypothetical protein
LNHFRHSEEAAGVEVGDFGPDQDEVDSSGQQVQVRGPRQSKQRREKEERLIGSKILSKNFVLQFLSEILFKNFV